MAFPTETVYGVGGDLFNLEAVREVFRIKNRPLSNPLLVHISNLKQLEEVVGDVPPLALKLMERFWPGALSLVLPVDNNIAPLVTGGKNNVGLRMVSHPVAQLLIDNAGALAATSANLSGHFSPTSALHVKDDLDGVIAAIIDAGPTGIGIESTIIDLSLKEAKIIRLGGIALEEIEEAAGVKLDYIASNPKQTSSYQAVMQVLLSENEENFMSLMTKFINKGKKIGIVHNNYSFAHKIKGIAKEFVINLNQPTSELFNILRAAEKDKLDLLIFAPIPHDNTGVNKALVDRISKFKSLMD